MTEPAPATPPRREDCVHPDFRANVAIGRMEDSGKFIADIHVECAVCGEPFRFVGCDAGVNFGRPMVSIDGLELHAPIEPQGEAKLMARATFTMPTIPQRH